MKTKKLYAIKRKVVYGSAEWHGDTKYITIADTVYNLKLEITKIYNNIYEALGYK